MKDKNTILNKAAIRKETGMPISETRKYPDNLDKMSLGNVVLVKTLLEKELQRIKEKLNKDENK